MYISSVSTFQPFSSGKIGFLIEGFRHNTSPDDAPHLLEGKYIAEHNRGIPFDCIHSFDSLHISTFLNRFPPILHKRISLYIVRIYINVGNVDDLLRAFIKPALQHMIDSGQVYTEMPSWLNDLTSEHIMDTISLVQQEVGGYENMQSEFNLIKRKLLGCSNELSANAFKKYLEEHRDITEVVGFIGQIHLHFLNRTSVIKKSFSDTERHLVYIQDDRQIPVHLFGTDDIESYRHQMRLFTLRQSMRIPYDHEEDITIEPLYGYQKIVQGYECFKTWWDRYEHNGLEHEELLAWFHEDEQTDKYIESYQDFLQLIYLAREKGFTFETIPDEKSFESAFKLRQAKKLQRLDNMSVFPETLSEEHRLKKVKEIHQLWLGTEKPKPKDESLTLLEVLNTGMDIALSTRKRTDKWLSSRGSVGTSSRSIPNDRIHTSVQKMIQTYAVDLVDLLPISTEVLSAKEMSIALKKYLDLLRLAHEAIIKFSNREMALFDPLVGENACQIRAAMFSEILNKSNINEMIATALKRLTLHSDKINALLDKLNQKEGLVSSLKVFLAENEACFAISDEIMVIISSYILTETKVIEYKPNKHGVPVFCERLPPNLLSERKGLSTKFAASLIRAAQAKLSEFSVIYVQRIALNLLSEKEEKLASELAFNNVKTDQLHRKIVPFYHSMRLLLTDLYRKHIPIIIKVKQFVAGHTKHFGKMTLVFGNQGLGQYSLIQYPKGLSSKAAICFHAKSITKEHQGFDALKQKFLETPLADLILSASADHPQLIASESITGDPIFQKYRQKALEWGACYDNPSVFMVEHVFCKTLK
jgi:hypothetical protein